MIDSQNISFAYKTTHDDKFLEFVCCLFQFKTRFCNIKGFFNLLFDVQTIVLVKGVED